MSCKKISAAGWIGGACGASGGIGRHGGVGFRWLSRVVQVRVLSRALQFGNVFRVFVPS